MTALLGDVINRVKRLPKPSNAGEALQPIFEAVSNSIHAADDAKRSGTIAQGIIDVNIATSRISSEVRITVGDNGVGLDADRYQAFLTTDSAFKMSRGGKGVGRLLWLDAFEKITVTSIYAEGDALRKRSFRFVLDPTDQIQGETIETLPKGAAPTGTHAIFEGLQAPSYQKYFPVQPAAIVRHFGSHFLAEFILGNAPRVSLTVGPLSVTFPDGIRQMLIEDRGESIKQTEEFGELRVRHFVFRKAASAGFDGIHQLHFIANGRTVTTRKIDGLLGLGRFGADKVGVYHGCVSGPFLDERVNQERTHFNFDDKIADAIAKIAAEVAIDDALQREIGDYDADRLITMEKFLGDYPSFGFAPAGDLLARTPKNATKGEQFAQALIPTRIRRDIERRRVVQTIVTELGDGTAVSGDFSLRLKSAADEVHAEEQRQLTEYVLRRKIVLDVLDVLLRRFRQLGDGVLDHQLEETLHTFLCPMRVRGDNPNQVEATEHDLWVLDERLAFAKYFASDVPVSQLIEDARSSGRPDILIWDRLHGLGVETDEPLRKVMLVEFKKPNRTSYPENYTPGNQIFRYLAALSNGEVESFGRRVRLANDCVFSCYIIADIVGAMDVLTAGWATSAGGRGRWMPLHGKYRGSIELIEWDDVLLNARSRNSAFIELARS